MKLVEFAKMTIGHGGLLDKKSELSLYFTIKKILIDKISESAFEDVSEFLRCCITHDENRKTMRITIFLGEPFYNKHLGKLVKDARRKELSRWLSNTACATTPQLLYLGTGR